MRLCFGRVLGAFLFCGLGGGAFCHGVTLNLNDDAQALIQGRCHRTIHGHGELAQRALLHTGNVAEAYLHMHAYALKASFIA